MGSNPIVCNDNDDDGGGGGDNDDDDDNWEKPKPHIG